MPDQPVLTYFELDGGRGEDCRIALHIAGVPFVDDRVRAVDWPGRKPGTPLGVLPTFEVPGRGRLHQSNAILAFIGRGHGLHPADSWEAARHESVMASCEDARAKFAATFGDDDPELKRKRREDIVANWLPRWARAIEAEIGAGPFLSGETLQVADLKLYIVMRWLRAGVLDHVPRSALDGHAKLTAHFQAVQAHPGVESWQAARRAAKAAAG
jgi:glutathione S-transferase